MSQLIKTNVNLQPLNTMAVPSIASHFISIQNQDGLLELLTKHIHSFDQSLILGGGSNILLNQKVEALVIHNQLKGKQIIYETEELVEIKVAAGENWHDFVLYCVEKNYGGLENLSLIPGTVGAAPIQNIGAYGVEVKDVITSVEAYEIKTAKPVQFTNTECEFDYRSSIFKTKLQQQFIITHVTFKLSKHPILQLNYGAIQDTLHQMNFSHLSIKVVSDAIIKIRQSKLPDPSKVPNTGSFFKNPIISLEQFSQLIKSYPNMPHYAISDKLVKIPAGWLIEQCGWKGQSFGKVAVYDKQALVITNPNHGSAAEVLKLADAIQKSVQEKFQISLEPEVRII